MATGKALPEWDKSDSYIRSINALYQLASQPEIKHEAEYWDRTIPDTVKRLPSDFEMTSDQYTFDSMVFAEEVYLDNDRSRILMEQMVVEYGVQSVVVVLSAIANAVCQWSGDDKMYIDVGRLGREVKDNQVDLSEALGWHAVTIPVSVDAIGQNDPLPMLKAIHAKLEDMPYSGSHFNLLKYLSDDEQIRQRLQAKPQPEISLNYFPGSLDVKEPQSDTETPREVSLEPYVAEQNFNLYPMTLWVRVINGRLGVNLQYSTKRYSPETIETLLQTCVRHLQQTARDFVEQHAPVQSSDESL